MSILDRITQLSVVLCLASLLLSPWPADAGGFQITEQCTVCQGKRNAGSAASADAPGTVYFNPANLSWIDAGCDLIEVGIVNRPSGFHGLCVAFRTHAVRIEKHLARPIVRVVTGIASST